jgi:hypothetical protein
MIITNASLYLPISDRALAVALDSPESLESSITGFSIYQIASLIVLQFLVKLSKERTILPERVLAEIIDAGNVQTKRDGMSAFRASALSIIDHSSLVKGRDLLTDFEIALLEDDVIRQEEFLTFDSKWDYRFTQRHKAKLMESLQCIDLPIAGNRVLTSEQSKIFREIRAQTDDHMHVQGYAGTGKSYLIRSLLALLQGKGAKVLVLAERARQLKALMSDMGKMENIHERTFDELVREITPRDLTNPVNRRMHRENYSMATVPDDVIAQHLGVRSSNGLSAQEIVRIVRGAVAGFCFSGDTELEVNHIPSWSESSLDEVTRGVVLHYAVELWKETLLPSRGFRPPIRGYHRVKWAALNEWKIPSQYTHVLIDECHDLAKPMLQILDCSPQAVISLGDEYQNLRGRPQSRSNIIRRREVTCSVRSAHQIERIVNPIIAAHPCETKPPFHGNPLSRLEISYYDQPQVPDRPTVILVNDIWGLFEWAQRLAVAQLDFALLSHRENLNMFVNDCIELFQRGTRPRHGELFRFESWEAVAMSWSSNKGFQRIDRMLKKAYSYEDWINTSGRFAASSTTGYALGLVADVRNLEFESVMLAPELGEDIWENQGAVRAAAASATYVAVTRARRHLIIPARFET